VGVFEEFTMHKIIATTALASLLAAPAFAGALIFEPAPEPVVAAPAPAPAPAPVLPNWTGGYVGGTLGWAIGDGGGVGDSDDGFNFGAQAGYDFDLGNQFVIGGEAAYERPDVSLGGDSVDQLVRLTARAGYSFGNTLAYVRGGGAWVDGDPGSDWGWTAGVGVEQLITNNISAGVDYNYHRVDDWFANDNNLDLHTVGARLNFRF
jgi:outer membrane immunogenic protein